MMQGDEKQILTLSLAVVIATILKLLTYLT
jgi:hypothetical protein